MAGEPGMADRGLSRRKILLGAGAALAAQAMTQLTAAAFDWKPVTPGGAGFAPDLEARLDQLIDGKRAWNLHAVVIARAGRLVLERYFEGPDNARGRPLGQVTFRPDTLHDLRSATKGIVGLLYGIALAAGKVPPPEAPLFASFPEYPELAAAAGRDRITVHHVLTMTMGMEWDETSLPYSDPRNSETAMDIAPDRYRFVLARPIVAEPGRYWHYNGGATALLARIIAKGIGKPLADFAREALFDPLGIGPTEWFTSKDGEPIAASGLRMTPRDLARIGQLMLNGGTWGDRRVVSAAWLDRSVTPLVSVDEARRYGYQWYVGDFAFGEQLGWRLARLERWWGGVGEGGQRLFVMPSLDLVVAITAGNYLMPDQWIPPTLVMREVVLASIR
jgi:CubicO group peptidase (beta-lactamase class C family)